MKTSRISRSCSLSIPAKVPTGGQFVPVRRSTLDTTAKRPRNIALRAAGSRGYFWPIAILLLLSVDGSRAELPVTDRRGFAPLIERVVPAVVSITASGLTPKGDNSSELDQEDESGGKDSVTGSGVILSADGYIAITSAISYWRLAIRSLLQILSR